MSHNQVIIIENPTFIHVKDACLTFEQRGSVVAKMLPEDIDCLILHYSSTITAAALATLAEQRAAVMLLDKHQLPLAHWLPPKSKNKQKTRLKNLINLVDSILAEKLWQKIVISKIKGQIYVLNRFDCKGSKNLFLLITKVKLKDIGNVEAQAARIYWKALFGEDFKRQKQGTSDPINQHLNFGYSIIRSLIAKYLSGRSIALEWGIYHTNQNNPMCLVDDLMEPFRFIVDMAVKDNLSVCSFSISAKSKRELLKSIYKPVLINGQQCRLSSAIDICSMSFSRILDKPSKATANWLIVPYCKEKKC